MIYTVKAGNGKAEKGVVLDIADGNHLKIASYSGDPACAALSSEIFLAGAQWRCVWPIGAPAPRVVSNPHPDVEGTAVA